MFDETIMDVVGYMDFRGERLSYWDRMIDCYRPVDVRLTWTQFTDIRSFLDDLVEPDRVVPRFASPSTVSLSTRQITVWPLDTSMLAPQSWEPFTFTYLSDQGWIMTSATCAVVDTDTMYGTEWRVRPSDYMEDGLTFRRAVMTGA